MMNISTFCSRHFTYEALFHCGETWQQYKMQNIPIQHRSWSAFAALANHVLDPLADQFGIPTLTFGFCGPLLVQKIKERLSPGIAPQLDQHSSCEVNQNGQLICKRMGASVDLIYPSKSSLEIAKWLIVNTPFDRIYFYGDSRALHVSYGPEHKRQVVLISTKNGHRMPQVVTAEKLQRLTPC